MLGLLADKHCPMPRSHACCTWICNCIGVRVGVCPRARVVRPSVLAFELEQVQAADTAQLRVSVQESHLDAKTSMLKKKKAAMHRKASEHSRETSLGSIGEGGENGKAPKGKLKFGSGKKKLLPPTPESLHNLNSK